MADEFRTPYDSEYVSAIGRAIYIFAIYEWNVVHAMEKLRPGFVNEWRFAKRPMMAGKLGANFEETVNEANDLALPVASRLKEAARAFMEFVDERNELVHAHHEFAVSF
jgi:hypothetical protein